MMIRRAQGVMRALFLAGLVVPLGGFAVAASPAPGPEGIDATSFSGSYLAARTADVEKDIPSAAQFYRSALKTDPDNVFLLERTLVISAAAGDVTEALALAGDLSAKSPSNHAARLLRAVEQLRTKQYAEAIVALDNPGAGVIADLTAALIVAWARFGQGQAEQAVADLGKLEGEEWYEPFKRLHSGYMMLAAGQTDQALELLADARELDPNAVRITEAYARALAIAGRKPEAEEALRDFLVRFPDNALAVAALKAVSSAETIRTVATPAEGAAEALAGIGAAVGQEGGLEVASLYLRLALYLDPQTGGGLAALSLGNLLDSSNQGEAAIKVFESIAPDAPFRGLGALRAALALDRMDRTEEAERAFEEAIGRNPEDVQNYVQYGNMLRGRERFAEAAEIYSKAIARIPAAGKGDWSLFYFRGIAYERTKAWDKAEADFRKALELSPDQPLVLNYLGYSLVDMGRNLEEGMTMIRKAVELRPNDGYIVDSLGWAYYRLGKYDEAVTELERAVSLKADDPVIHDHLGDAYWQTGRILEAQFQWRHARDFGAKPPELDLILRKIAEGRLVEPEKDSTAIDPVQPAPAPL